MGGGLRGSVGGGFGADSGPAPSAHTHYSTSTSTPRINSYTHPRIPVGVNLSEYIPTVADAGCLDQRHGIGHLPPRDVKNAVGAQSVNDILVAPYARLRSSKQLLVARPPILLTYDAEGNIIQLARVTPATPFGAQAEGGSSTATELHRTPTLHAQS